MRTEEKNVPGEKGMRDMGWEDMRSEGLREECRSLRDAEDLAFYSTGGSELDRDCSASGFE